MDVFSQTNPLVWVFGAGLVVLGFVFWLRSRAGSQSTDLKPMLAVLKQRQPEFHQILAAVEEEKGMPSLLQHPDAGPAVKKLRESLLNASAPSGGSLLQLGAETELGAETKGAMITILRALYFDNDLRARLPQSVDQALDGALDRLTG